jgi:GxxExxY protein
MRISCRSKVNAMFQSSTRAVRIRGFLKLDLLVEDSIVVELKAVESLHLIHQAQVITYLKLTGRPAGLLMNFNTTSLKYWLKRVDDPEGYRRMHAKEHTEEE